MPGCSDPRSLRVAVAADETGRAVFISSDDREFSQVAHFPRSLDEAEALRALAKGPSVLYEELVAMYAGRVAMLELTEAGHGPAVAASA